MDKKPLADEVIAKLNQLSDPKRKAWAENNYASSLTIKGVSIPNIRPIVKDLSKKFKQSSPEEVIEFTKLLFSEQILEAQLIAIEVIDKHKTARQSLTHEDLLLFSEGMDNWLSVDYFAGMLAGPAWREGQISDDIVEKWAVSENRWLRRAAVVCTVALNQKARGGQGDTPRTLKICEYVIDDTDEMVAKALSWALRELAKRDLEPVIAFINSNEKRLPKRVLREVRRKIETGRKYK